MRTTTCKSNRTKLANDATIQKERAEAKENNPLQAIEAKAGTDPKHKRKTKPWKLYLSDATEK